MILSEDVAFGIFGKNFKARSLEMGSGVQSISSGGCLDESDEYKRGSH